jgi:hypothetical protein
VSAHNSRGWSEASPDNTVGATIETEPSAMAAPTNGSTTNTAQIEVDWTALVSPADGDSPITSYALYWDSGSSGASFTALIGSTTTYTSTSYIVTSGITSGSSY